MARQRAIEEQARLVRLVVAPPDEHGRGHLVGREAFCELRRACVRAWFELPGSGRHRRIDGTDAVGQNLLESALNWRLVLRTLAALVAAAGLACAAAPASERTHTIASGVSVAGVSVGGLSAEPARAAIEAALRKPATLSYDTRKTTIEPAEVGAATDVNAAVASALAATARSEIALPVTYSWARAGEWSTGSRARRPACGRRSGGRRDGGRALFSGVRVRALRSTWLRCGLRSAGCSPTGLANPWRCSRVQCRRGARSRTWVQSSS